ncbi:Nicotinamidase-related amidase [Kordiimonas lacus]|uniref:Nicotinamidase-related amidase n=2 Tax=Kordiimonas lacus TaxID=637679 RepID=A0A1G6TLS7_9PROT|nr:Nicotinamidase-related amidase [Kordiimonas lacus]
MGAIMTNTALIIIDTQIAIDDPKWGVRNNVDAEANMARLLDAWRTRGGDIIHIRHDSVCEGSPYTPGTPGHAFKPQVAPQGAETVIGKTTNNAFVGAGLEKHLRARDIQSLVIAGVLTQHSVDTTARMAASLGFEVTVVSDATAATEVMDGRGMTWLAADVHALTLAHLAADYATVKTTDEILGEIL